MKTFRFLAITLIWALAFTGCSKDDNIIVPGTGGNTDGGDIVFYIGFAPQNEGKVQTYVATDAQFKSTWEDGDEIGIYAVKRAVSDTKALATAGNYMQNVKLTYSETDDKWTGGAYYTNDGDVLDFYAYYPYDAMATDPANITFNVSADQSTAANYGKSDLLSATPVKGIAKGTTVDLTFAHKLALVQVEVPSTMKGSGPSENLAITLRSCKVGGAFNLGDGSLTTTGDAVAVKMLRVEKSGDADFATKYTYRALVPAQTVAQGSSLCLMAQNGQFYNTPTLTSALDLTASEAKLYTAELSTKAIQTVKIANGTFQMGSPDSDTEAYGDEKPQYWVKLTQDFYMSKYQITNAQYAAFLNAKSIGDNGEGSVTYNKDGSSFTEDQTFITSDNWDVKWDTDTDKWLPQTGYENHPVINVTWFGAKAYADWVGGSLPTEAQWEYACRAGTTTAFSFGDNSTNNIGDYAWYSENSSNSTKAVGQKTANPLGLYDMHGNVLEWCLDQWDGSGNYPTAATEAEAVENPLVTAGTVRVRRGGDWRARAQLCRSAVRHDDFPGNASYIAGFRVVFVP